MIRPLLLLYFASGLGAVAVETVWMRWLRELLGATAPAASATLVAFFTGHALGAAWIGRRAQGVVRPLALYGRLELAAAAGACAVPLLLAAGGRALGLVYDALRDVPAALAAMRFSIALVASLPAAFCFGASFPAITSAAVGSVSRLGGRGAWLYAANTLGAALGTALATFWLPAAVGVRATYALAVACLVAAGATALAWGTRWAVPASSEDSTGATQQPARARSTRRDRRRARDAAAPGRTGGPVLGPRSLLALAAGGGFGAFAAQVLLVQAFAQVLNQSIHAFGAVLVAVLLAIAAAGATVAALDRHASPSPLRVLGWTLGAAALALAATPAWLAWLTSGLGYVGGGRGGYLGAALGTVAVAAGPAIFAASLVFPATFAAAGRSAAARAATGADRAAAHPGTVLGRLAAANTLGAIAGALAAPYWMLASVGLWPSFAALAAAYAVAALLLPAAGLRARALRAAVVVAGLAAIALVASPLSVPPFALAPGERALEARTTPAAVVGVVERDGERLLRIDNHYALGGTAEIVHQQRQAHLPLVLAPGAKRVAYVGSATGISAGAVLDHPVDALFLVELVPGVAEAAARWFTEANRGVYSDPRTTVVLDDARNFLATTGERFDVVVADLFVPWQAGAGALYTREHFAAVRARLEPGGLFCQWLPLYQLGVGEFASIAATFGDVFPGALLFRGDFYGRFPIAALVGWAGEPPAPAAIEAASRRLAAGAGIADRWVADPAGVWALYVGPLAALDPELGRAPRNTDDRPLVEALAAATHAGGDRGKLDPLVGPAWIRLTERLRAGAGAAPERLPIDTASRRSSQGGAALQAAGALYVTGQFEAAARAFARAAALLPPRLVAEAPADPTAAELWSADRTDAAGTRPE